MLEIQKEQLKTELYENRKNHDHFMRTIAVGYIMQRNNLFCCHDIAVARAEYLEYFGDAPRTISHARDSLYASGS